MDNKQFEAWNKNTVKVYFAHGSFLVIVTGSIRLLPSARKGSLYLSTQREERLRKRVGWRLVQMKTTAKNARASSNIQR
jgi:hypothetical protein